jgi:hypothetical protein
VDDAVIELYIYQGDLLSEGGIGAFQAKRVQPRTVRAAAHGTLAGWDDHATRR